MGKKIAMLIFAVMLVFALSACSDSADKGHNMDHSSMNHTSSGEIPEGLKTAQHPAYKPGSGVILKADHMKGMNGAKATVKGAYDTTAYVLNYTPSNGGKKVKNHKWVIKEEIKDAKNKDLSPGAKVTLKADHMKGMKGAEAEIVSSEKTVVYMVDYTPVSGGKEVKNHKWVTEDELSAK
ncbi:Protein of unknown function [Bacillus sp. OV322]|nr:Protein of unknown function [Bacillus sp. OV322]